MNPSSGSFRRAETPVEADLVDVTAVDDATFAVGERGAVLESSPRTDGWTLRSDGDWPTRGGADRVDPPVLTGIDTTADGGRAWFAGVDGCVGYFDATRDTTLDLTPQVDEEVSFTAVAVAGPTGRERAILADQQGRVVEADVNGTTASFGPPTRLAGGAEITALAADDAGTVGGCDVQGHVFYWTADDGWAVRDATDRRLSGVTLAAGELLLATADGDVLRYDRETADSVVERTDAAGFANVGANPAAGGEAALAVGAGVIAERTATGWTVAADVGVDSYAVACADRDVVVGADGTVLER